MASSPFPCHHTSLPALPRLQLRSAPNPHFGVPLGVCVGTTCAAFQILSQVWLLDWVWSSPPEGGWCLCHSECTSLG